MNDMILAIISSMVLVGLIYFIISNAITTRNYKTRSIIYLLTSIILLIGCVFAYLYDGSIYEEVKLINFIIFPGTIVLISSILVITSLVKAKRYHHHLRGYRHRQVNDIELYLYIVYKFDNKYLLKYEDDKYRGERVKFNRNVFFHDEMINKFLEKVELNIINKKFIGEAFNENKKKSQYFCYLVELNENILDGYTEIDQYTIGEIDANEFDKQIILRIVIGNNFNIKV